MLLGPKQIVRNQIFDFQGLVATGIAEKQEKLHAFSFGQYFSKTRVWGVFYDLISNRGLYNYFFPNPIFSKKLKNVDIVTYFVKYLLKYASKVKYK